MVSVGGRQCRSHAVFLLSQTPMVSLSGGTALQGLPPFTPGGALAAALHVDENEKKERGCLEQAQELRVCGSHVWDTCCLNVHKASV